MKKIVLACESVRINIGKFAKKVDWDGLFRANINRHYVANTFMVLCNRPPISKKYQEKALDTAFNSKCSIYNTLVSKDTVCNFSADPFIRETGTEFKSGSLASRKGQSGCYNKRWLANSAREKKVENPQELVDELEVWLKNRYPDCRATGFQDLMEKWKDELPEFKTTGEDMKRAQDFIDAELPEKFREILGKAYFHQTGATKHSKYTTFPYFVRPNGKVVLPDNKAGAVITVGGPRYLLNACFNITIDLTDDNLYYQIKDEARTGPGYAAIGDGGVARILQDGETSFFN